MPWKVRFFQTRRGDYPVKEFIIKQDEITYAKILGLIKLLKDYCPLIKPPYVKKIIKNIWELRISARTAIRILYCFINNEFYLLHAFKKKSKKTPLKEIEIAIDRFKNII